MQITSDDFRKNSIAQKDDCDYQESGWVCWHVGDRYFLAWYSHCSCYDTFASLCGGGVSDYFVDGDPSATWSGTKDELLALAMGRLDPAMPDRPAVDGDYDYGYLMDVYIQILEHFGQTRVAERRRRPTPTSAAHWVPGTTRTLLRGRTSENSEDSATSS